MPLLRKMWVSLVVLTLPLAALAGQAANDTGESIEQLITQRLLMMKDVAAYKWLHQRPVEDLAREQVVITNAVNTGLEAGIRVDSSRQFFGAQIHAAKLIQQCWFDRWQQGEAPTTSPDLTRDIRPRLIDLGNRISRALGQRRGKPRDQPGSISVPCLPEAAGRDLIIAVDNIRFYPDQLTQVLDSVQLRIGTTGDYAPFSSDASSSDASTTHYTGIDIDMAEDLADSLGVEARFIQTSWPTLMADLAAGRFDIAMSGVSRTLSRARTGYFSTPYHVGGKTPITVCHRAGDFDELARIDQAGVRVIVNPGGTNEKFIDTRISAATKILHDDNRTIFEAIINDKADLMITDAIEVRLQSNRHPELCPAMPGRTLTYQEKGYLLPQDDAWLHAVNLWLAQRRGDGTLERYFTTHLSR